MAPKTSIELLEQRRFMAAQLAGWSDVIDNPLMPLFPGSTGDLEPDALIVRVQPDEGLSLRFGAKVPGHAFRVQKASMDFSYESFEQKFSAFNDWAVSVGKPAMAGEYASQQMEPGRRAQWINDMRTALKTRLTGILAVNWFHSLTTDHDWRLTPEPDAFDAFRQMGFDPFFNP